MLFLHALSFPYFFLMLLVSNLFVLDRLRSLCETLHFQTLRSFEKLWKLVLRKNRFNPTDHLLIQPTWATLTSPAYMNSRMAVRCWKGTSFRMMMGCLAGFSSSRALK